MVRLSSPVAHDIVGIVTAEDLMLQSVAFEETYRETTSSKLGQMDILREDMLGDDLPEFSEDISYHRQDNSVIPGLRERPPRPPRQTRDREDRGSSSTGIEMTLIEPYTKKIFKRSQGGYFGTGGWPVSGIKAFAVWF
jgi:hypothetical protein